MLFHSSLRRELGRSFGATLVVLVTIVMTMILIRTLGQASKGSVNPSEIIMLMGFSVVGYLPVILTMALFISVVGTLSRMYSDSEMVIWFTAGRGLSAFLGPLMRFAWPVLLVIALLSLVAWPWTNQQTQDMRDNYERRGDVDRIAPGQFQESSGGRRVFFIDRDSVDGKTGRNVFISSREKDRESVTSARTGRIETIGQDRFLVLNRGQRLDTHSKNQDLKVFEFTEYATRVGDAVLFDRGTTARARSSLTLITDPTPLNQGELAWRIGIALAAINLVVIAVAVASVSPRAGRSGNLLFALFAFMVYLNLINLGQSWISTSRVSAGGFIFALHGSALALALLWLAKRHNNWSLRALLSPRRAVESPST